MKVKRDKRDILFSTLIRERDGFRCVFCGRTKDQGYVMTCSHFWGRGNKRTRFDPENCDTLCFQCHANNEGNKQGFYREWKLKQLGTRKYNKLEKRARSIFSYTRYEKDIIYGNLKESGLDEPYKELI